MKRQFGRHQGDSSDEQGRALPITIRIAPDGRLYFNDITLDVLPVALAMCPVDAGLLARERAAAGLHSPEEAE